VTLRCVVILLAVGALGGCGGGDAPSHHRRMGRLDGAVTRGPTTPVCRAGTPCSKPASGTRLAFQRNGGAVTSIVVAKDGSYSVSLAPGVYTVTVSPQAPVGRGIDPGTVKVIAGHRRRVDFRIDTGIR
jgi:hypothetical protein